MTKKEENQYCVVAESRETNIRESITDPMTRAGAEAEKERLNRELRRYYRYFHVARYPYRPKKAGS